jgi:low affinity Fe/Cu permease
MASDPTREGSWAYRFGCKVSDTVSDVFAHPYAQVTFILVCLAWFAVGLNVSILTAALSIMAITLTQMVLNSQNEREIDDHRRDVAMHAKLDELIASTKQARNEFVAVEEKDEDEIVQLKEEVKEAIEDAPPSIEPTAKETAKKMVEAAAEGLKRDARKKRNGAKAPKKASRAK